MVYHYGVDRQDDQFLVTDLAVGALGGKANDHWRVMPHMNEVDIEWASSAVRATAAGVMLLLVLASAAPAAVPCKFQPPPGVPTTASSTGDGERQETVMLGDGRRSVTRCRPDGSLIESVDLAILNLRGRPTEEVLARVMPGPLGGFSITAYFYASSDLATGFAPSSSEPKPQGPPLAARAAADPDDSCTNSEFVRDKSSKGTIIGWPTRKYTYFARTSSMPHGDSDRVAITKGHHAWDNTLNTCGFSDITNLTSTYGGTTTTTFHSSADGTSVVDFGSLSALGASNNAIALARSFVDSSNRLKECDQRFEQPIAFDGGTASWSLSDAPNGNQLDVWSVASHETGHCIGLGHANSSHYWLTMAPIIFNGTTHQRTLGRGDVLGLRAIYP